MTKEALESILRTIDELFDKTKFRLLGPEYAAKSMVFSVKKFDPANTLTSLYLHALSDHSVSRESIDKETIKKINDVFDGYFSAISDGAKQKAESTLTSFIHEADVKAKLAGITTEMFLNTDAGQSIKEEASKAIGEIVSKANASVNRVVVNEMHNAQSYGALDGIIGLSNSLDIPDPVVFKIGVIDEKMCKACRKLWHMEDINIPRLYKLSQLRGGYENLKDPQGTIGMTHPHCRHVLTTLLPGFGFDASGKVVYVGQGHDEYSKQQ